jgi:hypothetical protein
MTYFVAKEERKSLCITETFPSGAALDTTIQNSLDVLVLVPKHKKCLYF